MKRSLLRILAWGLFAATLAGCQTVMLGPHQPTFAPTMAATDNPPMIPHPVVEAASGKDCLSCHRDGLAGATKTPHPQWVNCRQCHISEQNDVAPFSPSS